MNDQVWNADTQQKLKVLQIIYAALIGGAIVFAGIALLMSMAMVEQVPDDPELAPLDVSLFRYVWFGLFAMSFIGVLVVRRFMPSLAHKELAPVGRPPAGPMGSYLAMTIITGALLESASLFGSIILLLGDQPADLALAIVPLAFMLPFFPTRDGFERFVGAKSRARDPEGGLQAPQRDHRNYR